jgi:hypothetical protein
MEKVLTKKDIRKILDFEEKRDITKESKWNQDMQYGYIQCLKCLLKR